MMRLAHRTHPANVYSHCLRIPDLPHPADATARGNRSTLEVANKVFVSQRLSTCDESQKTELTHRQPQPQAADCPGIVCEWESS